MKMKNYLKSSLIFFKKIKNIIIIILIIKAIFLLWVFWPILSYKADYKKLAWNIYISDRFWKTLTNKQKQAWYYKSINIDLKSQFIKDLIKIEDKNYYEHFGIDVFSKFWAILSNMNAWNKISWWSTITEQYIKNKYFIWYDRNYLQKLREINISFFYSLIYKKDDLLKNYLDNLYFWNQIYGIWWAIEVYFWKNNLNDLSQEEIVLLISLINNPSIKSLDQDYFKAYFEKIKNKLWYNFKNTYKKLNKKENIDLYPHITNRILSQIKQDSREIRLKSTIDLELQNFAKDILNTSLDTLKWKNVSNWAIIAINPKTQEPIVYLWSRDFYSKEIDWQVDIISSLRQPWSTLKSFLYLEALKSGVNIDDFLIDIESEYNSFKESTTYISQNYSLKEYWLVRFRKALWNSFNNSSVRLARELWLYSVWKFFKEYWIKLDKEAEYYGYSLVLWNPSISLENLVLSYINLLPEIKLDNSRKLNFLFDEEYKENNDQEIDIDKFLLYKILINPDNRDISFGVNSILNTSIPQAVKTWTSSNFKDNVVVSYNNNLILLVWLWNNDNSSMIWVSWISWAWYIWHQIIEKAIDRWIIIDKKYDIEDSLKFDYCLNESCNRKEQSFKKTWKIYKSYIIDNSYSSDDLFEKLNSFELSKLKDLGFYLK